MITTPADNISSESTNEIQFSDIFDLEDIQRLQDAFSESSGVGSIITYPDGTPITRPSNFCRLCTIIRATTKGLENCMKSDATIGKRSTSGRVVVPCLSGGLWDAGTNIIVGGKHIANWLIGQVRDKDPDMNRMIQYADEIGLNREEFFDALSEVPVMSEEQFTRVSKMLFVFANEISEKAYKNLQLKTSEEKFRKAFLINPDAININRLVDGMYISINKGFTQIMGYSEEDVLGKTSLELNIWENPDDRKILISGLKSKGVVENLEANFCSKTGKRIYGLMSAAIIELEGISHIISISRDITTRKHVEAELRMAKEKAEESDRLKTAFLHNMSHEIRTPMNAIMGFSELLIYQHHDRAKQEKFSGIIRERCEDLLQIIDETLFIAALESGQLTVTLENCSINELFDAISEHFREYSKKGINQNIEFIIQNDWDTANMTILADKIKVQQVLNHLIENAFKFTDSGSILVGCKFSEERKPVFYVTDTGIGIPSEKHNAVFDRFVKLENDSQRIYSGTGLGLSIVKGLVQLLSGSVWVESEPGKGSTFYFSFPCQIVAGS